MLVTPSSVTQVWARTQHAPSFAVIRTAVRLHLRNQTMYLLTVSFVSFRRTFMSIIYHVKMVTDIQTEIIPSKEPVVREIDMKNLLSQFITLNSKENFCMWYRCYVKNQIPRIHTLLWHISGRPRIFNLRIELMCQISLGTCPRIYIQLPQKRSLGQDVKLSSAFRNMISMKN